MDSSIIVCESSIVCECDGGTNHS